MICPDCGLLRHPGRKCEWRVCTECAGHGSTIDEYHAGGHTPDRWVEVRERKVQCEVCDGWGEIAVDPSEDD